MSINIKRFGESGELVSVFHISMRLKAEDFVTLLGRYSSRYISKGDEPPALNRVRADAHFRNTMSDGGTEALWRWLETHSLDVQNACLEWGQTEAIRLWPDFSDDFRRVDIQALTVKIHTNREESDHV